MRTIDDVKFLFGKPIAHPKLITEFENLHGIRLPKEFRRIVLTQDGASLDEGESLYFNRDMKRWDYVSCGALLGFGNRDIFRSNDLEYQPAGLVAFGVDGGGVPFCFDYREHKGDQPPVVLYFPGAPDDDVHSVAPSFELFIAMLGRQYTQEATFVGGEPLGEPGLITEFEERYRITLPAYYRSIVAEKDGSRPSCSGIIVRPPLASCVPTYLVDEMIGFGQGQMEAVKAKKGRPGLIPFAFGERRFFAFDYRKDRKDPNPPVVVYEDFPDSSVFWVAASFLEFTKRLGAPGGHFELADDSQAAFVVKSEREGNAGGVTLRGGSKLVDRRVIHGFEEEHGICLPSDFLNLVREHDGAALDPCECDVFDTRLQRVERFGCKQLLAFEGQGRASIFELPADQVERLPARIVPFGLEGGGYLFCFDYRRPAVGDQPSVVLFIAENEDQHRVMPVAKSFGGFLNLIESRD